MESFGLILFELMADIVGGGGVTGGVPVYFDPGGAVL